MCIAILNTKGTIAKKTLKTCFKNNPDGAGYAYTNGERVEIFKELKDFNLFYKNYREDRRKFPKSNFLIHFRIRTHGAVTMTNCHPFRVNEELAFIHNGMINITTQGEYSDTYAFNETILKQLPENFMDNPAILQLLEDFIGYSKVVLLNKHDEYVILNEAAGHWLGENWFSNYSYCDYDSGCKTTYGSVGSTKYTTTDTKGKSYNDYTDQDWDDWADDWRSRHMGNDTLDNEDVNALQTSFNFEENRTREAYGEECECCGDNYDVRYSPDEGMDLCKRCRALIFQGEL